ncbi:MAG TPA: S41 family peptidase [Gemmataceae bacterium]|nr:S41 family peptidase [Gemmataceae bacterium]
MSSTKPKRGSAKGTKSRRRPQPELIPAPRVSGAVPYKPKMSRAAALELIDATVGERIRLAEYRPTIAPLEPAEREVILDQALLMLEQVYVHLPLKRAIHAIEPIQRLRLLKLRHTGIDERTFQSELISIFVGLRDLHTNYVLPLAYAVKFAFLPFRVEEFYEAGARKYIVSWVSPVNPVRQLTSGMVVTHWNGSPIDLAVARNAEREAGSNPEARRARGVEALTLRWLGMSLPPDEDWVALTYTDGEDTYESKFDWEVIDATDRPALLAGLAEAASAGQAEAGWGLDLKTHLLHEVRKMLFDPPTVHVEAEADQAHTEARGGAAVAAPPRADVSVFPDVFPRFGAVDTPSGQFGYIRLRTFAPRSGDINGAVQEFARILATLPPSGLIVDARGNGGGYINFGERSLQLLTPGPIAPEPFHFLSTALTLGMARSNQWLGLWGDPIAQGIETGASFSQGFPLTDPEACNDIGQVYQGPVVLITDAFCYSTTDIFAAGFQDHGIGTILGTHKNTGAGGANVWGHQDVLQALTLTPQNPFAPLPQGARMRVAVRRSTRVGKRSGVPLEDLGVVPDKVHELTRADVLQHNIDLIAHAAKILAEKPRQSLRLTTPGGAPALLVKVEAENIDRLDLLVNGRVIASQDLAGKTADVPLPTAAPSGTILTGYGYRAGELVVSTRLRV